MSKVIIVANTDWYLYNYRFSLAKFLVEEGYQVVFCSPSGKYIPFLQGQGFRWIEWQVGRKTLAPWHEITSILKLAQLYRREKSELVHHHTIKAVLYGSLAARLARVPRVVNSITGRGYIFTGKDYTARLLRSSIKPLYRLAFRAPGNAVIFENNIDRQYFVENNIVSPEHTWLIEGVGVNTEIFIPLPEPEGIPIIMMAGRMLWDKGVGVLVEAARFLRSRTQARVVLVGMPDPGNPNTVDEATLRQWDQEGVIEWWGWRDDMREVYASSHIITLPTTYGEGVPTVLLEGAACARPLVVTDVPGCNSVVTNGINGFLVKPEDPQGLADALESLLLDPVLRNRMGQAGRQLVLEKYSSQLVNQATLRVYQAVQGNV